jgi:hypothetical protein
MKVKDFQIDYSSGLYSCCEEHVMEHGEEKAFVGMTITCEYCGESMTLKMRNGKLMWVGNRG